MSYLYGAALKRIKYTRTTRFCMCREGKYEVAGKCRDFIRILRYFHPRARVLNDSKLTDLF